MGLTEWILQLDRGRLFEQGNRVEIENRMARWRDDRNVADAAVFMDHGLKHDIALPATVFGECWVTFALFDFFEQHFGEPSVVGMEYP